MRKHRSANKRTYGTGSIFEHRGSWYGQWRIGGKLVKRKLAPIRDPGRREGLTRKQAEALLRDKMQATRSAAPGERVTVDEAGTALCAHLASLGRKRSTLASYDSHIRIDLAPFFGSKPLDKIEPGDVERLVHAITAAGKSPKTASNALGVLHRIFEHGIRRGWVQSNPVKLVERPRASTDDPDIRFLDHGEIEALLEAAPDDDLGRVERVMYLTAAMTGMRQGELLALRWQDVDWSAQRIRVRRSFVHGEFTNPKSKRSSRSVPLATRVARELDELHRLSGYQTDEDLVFAHPHTGKPIDRSKLLKRFKAALRRGGVREARFHDLRHTFGTRMAAAGVPMRTLQEFMGHRDFKTTLIYADYAPSKRDLEYVEDAFDGYPRVGADRPASHQAVAVR